MTSIDIDKINSKIKQERKYSENKWKKLKYKEFLKPLKREKIKNLILQSELRLLRLYEKKLEYYKTIKLNSDKLEFLFNEIDSKLRK